MIAFSPTAFITHPRSRAVSTVFATNSLLFGTWATFVPRIQNGLHLSDGALGLVLLGIPVGSLLVMPFSGWVINRWGVGLVTALSALGFCLAIILPFLANTMYGLTAALVAVGIANGLMDVSMNAAAATVEESDGIKFWSACHGMWSLGGMVGAALAGAISQWIPPATYVMGLSTLLILYNGLASRTILLRLPHHHEESASMMARPNRALLGLIFIALCVMLGEGAIADWSAIYLQRYLGATTATAGLGYAAFSLAMAAGRFTGDPLKLRFGGRALVQTGCLLSTAGLLLAIGVPQREIAILGFTLVGVGLSNIVPIAFSAGSKVEGVAPGAGIATVSFFAYGGFLFGPPLIGAIAQATSLTIGLGFVALMTALAFLTARRTPL